MLFAEVVATSTTVAATSKRSEKVTALAALLGSLEPSEIEPAVGFLSVSRVRTHRRRLGQPARPRAGTGDRGDPHHRRVDDAITALATTAGPGSQAVRRGTLGRLFADATAPEGEFLVHLLGGELVRARWAVSWPMRSPGPRTPPGAVGGPRCSPATSAAPPVSRSRAGSARSTQ